MAESNITSTGTVSQESNAVPAEKTITISQQELDRLIGERAARAKASALKEAESQWPSRFGQQLREMGIEPEELESLKQSKKKAEESTGEMAKLKQQLFGLQKQVDEYKTSHEQLIKEKVRGAVEELSERIGKSTKSQALTLSKLIGDSLKYQDGQVFVVDEKGEIDYQKSVEDIVKQKLDEYPFLKGPGVGGGSGGRPSGDSSGANKEPDLKTSEGRVALLQKMLSGQ